MDEAPKVIKYHYRRSFCSVEAVAHAFSYLSLICGMSFEENDDHPDIWSDEHQAAPLQAGLLIGNENDRQPRTYIRPGGEWASRLNFDPISEIISRLSSPYSLGPYSTQKLVPAPSNGRTLSGIISNFLKSLEDAGIVTRGKGRISLWSAPSRFGLALTHDIDIARRSVPGSARLLFHRRPEGGLRGLFDSLASSISGKPNPYDNVARWIEAEKELGIKSTFFVFAGDRAHQNDPKYHLENLAGAYQAIGENAFELGLHSGIECHTGDSLKDSKRQLETFSGIETSGVRPHYLSATQPDYWTSARDCGFRYSSSLGFDNAVGYVDGIDLPYIPFDSETDRSLDIIEFPIAIMDCGLIGTAGASSGEVFERGAKLIERTASTGGLIVLDWHQRTFYNPDYPGWARLCLDIVKHAQKLGADMVSLGEMSARLGTGLRGPA
jgi:peptidoglycan/xylan/chitin deacetylase (PgdA/CDA1 family)